MLRIATWRSLMLNNGFDDSTLNSLCLEFNEKQMENSETVKNAYSNWIKEHLMLL